MTLEEARIFRQTGKVVPTSASPCNFSPNEVLQKNVNSLDLPEQAAPITPQSYNQVPLEDVKLFRQFKYSDGLHRADGVAAEYNRGERLNSYLQKHGAKEFTRHYDN